MSLVGRTRELRRLHDLLAELPQRGAGLLLRGQPGIGKSALLCAAARSASERGMRVLRATGVQTEARLPFAGLHQLLSPVIDQLDTLAAPQRQAVLAAFGMTEREPPDLFLIALGTLNVLSEVATAAPVVVVVEDAHWLDRSTIDVLAFVARRIESEPILLLGAVRDGFDGGGLPELRLDGLDAEAAAALLDAGAPPLEPDVRTRLLAEAAGNPLALVELPLATAQLEPGTLLPSWLPLTARLEHAFAAQAGDLPEATRRLLLVAALNDGGSLSETLLAVVSGPGGRGAGARGRGADPLRARPSGAAQHARPRRAGPMRPRGDRGARAPAGRREHAGRVSPRRRLDRGRRVLRGPALGSGRGPARAGTGRPAHAGAGHAGVGERLPRHLGARAPGRRGGHPARAGDAAAAARGRGAAGERDAARAARRRRGGPRSRR